MEGELTPESCPVTSTCVPWHMHSCTHMRIHTNTKLINSNFKNKKEGTPSIPCHNALCTVSITFQAT